MYVMATEEAWLQPREDDSELVVRKCSLFRMDRKDERRGGGILNSVAESYGEREPETRHPEKTKLGGRRHLKCKL